MENNTTQQAKTYPEVSVRVLYTPTEKDANIPYFKNVKALVSVSIGGFVIISNIRVIQSESDKRVFVNMPANKTKSGYKERAYIADKELRKIVTKDIIEAVSDYLD